MIVVDASVVADALATWGPRGDQARARIRGEELHAPYLLDIEVLSAWRRWARAGSLDGSQADDARRRLRLLPVVRSPHVPLLNRCWELRGHATVYDATYVALAELLEVPLVTSDGRLARSPDLRCEVELLSTS